MPGAHREQAKQIFYELFWLPIGADKMPFALAVTAVDHYNTGSVSRLLAQCEQTCGASTTPALLTIRQKATVRPTAQLGSIE